MSFPDWKDTAVRRGTKIRIALWLLGEIGEGNIFTKAQLRAAFPGVEQADRRMRDLRDHGWVLDTSKEDPALGMNELRFVKSGEEVWKPGKASPAGASLSAKERMAVMAGDDYMCVLCGVTGGESYSDAPHQTAQLSVSRSADRTGRTRYVTECKRCRAGRTAGSAPDLNNLLVAIASLSEADRRTLASWIRQGRRKPSAVEKLWSQYRQLPAEERAALEARLELQ